MMATTKTGWSVSRTKYMRELVAERLTGKSVTKYVASLEARKGLEPEARTAYEFYFGATVKEVGFIQHPKIERAGCSPDGVVGKQGGLEIKCCDAPAHLEMIDTGIIDSKYLLQCHFGMACTGRKWWDFLSYEPNLPEELKIFKRRIERDNDLIAKIETAVVEFDVEVENKIAAIRRQNGSGLAIS